MKHPTIGSSPRVRGTAPFSDLNYSVTRFIPACAGNSCAYCAHYDHYAVHPRVCGEQDTQVSFLTFFAGSSPRVRGTVTNNTTLAVAARFIPACAGNRSATHRKPSSAAVHPRVCGEQCHPVNRQAVPSGSSPRVRGTGAGLALAKIMRRFIPACAGNRKRLRPRVIFTAVHPRVCGEQGCGARPI